FPEPLGPMRPTNSPVSTATSTVSRTFCAPYPAVIPVPSSRIVGVIIPEGKGNGEREASLFPQPLAAPKVKGEATFPPESPRPLFLAGRMQSPCSAYIAGRVTATPDAPRVGVARR